jgi:hypothetical protein
MTPFPLCADRSRYSSPDASRDRSRLTRRHVADASGRSHISGALLLRRLVPVVLVTALFGCGAGAGNAPRAAAPDTRTSRTQKREDPVKLIAPPPAYGNKIVMAEPPHLRP